MKNGSPTPIFQVMRYRKRYLEKKIVEAFKYYPVVAVLGARQTGKSTLIKNLFGNKIKTITFDPVQDIANARKDPDFFLQNHPAPLFLDEIQYAPELLSAIKRKVDETGKKSQYIISGSQNLSVLKNISESLAGRVSIQNLLPMGKIEIDEHSTEESFFTKWINNSAEEAILFSQTKKISNNKTLMERILRGGYPGTLDFPDHMFSGYWESYLQTYIERDIRTVANIGSLQTFSSFFGILAGHTAQEINPTEIGRELGIDRKTAIHWQEIAQATYQWINIPAFSRNHIKKLVSKSKGYFTDTSFACYMQRIHSTDALMNHPMLGRLIESYISLEIIKLFQSWPTKPNIYHYRVHSGAEVDLILDINGILYPIEIKAKTNPTAKDSKGFKSFRENFKTENIAKNLIICSIPEATHITKDTYAIPWSII